MLSYKYRFHGHGSLRYVFAKGVTTRTRHLMLRTTPNRRRLHSRAAVIVSKKISKAAVGRNRIRRRLFECVRQLWPDLEGTHDITLTVYDREVLDMPHDELVAEVGQLLKAAGLFEK